MHSAALERVLWLLRGTADVPGAVQRLQEATVVAAYVLDRLLLATGMQLPGSLPRRLAVEGVCLFVRNGPGFDRGQFDEPVDVTAKAKAGQGLSSAHLYISTHNARHKNEYVGLRGVGGGLVGFKHRE
ncbi:hypothetical protein GPECTOR_32g512 [Gonium pectorale]|uniref:Uncharacterized protein n=1 Tax=Gonium pectorale TaxID=33097 RepID=A0A150GDJ1_GONPE|nr:hypothetical protein GPECTOR_32g512 [Gonium pectorale]|eukprot:KXZ47899.1 hypothetical protein GPECTOR_32g512 [Gonium pectorale]